MKKIVFVLVALIVAAPAMATNVDVDAVRVGSTLDVDITYEATDGNLPRAFALDITVDSGQTITGISNFVTGESGPGNIGYGIFPANFARYIDPCTPNWSDVNYTPVADLNDLPGDTQGGLDTNGITIEMGSLYADPNEGPASPNSPLFSDTLCTITVSGGCTVSLALNVSRGGIVMEDGNAPDTYNLYGSTLQVEVPDVLLLDEAGATTAIEGVGLVISVTYECNDVEVAGQVLDQDPLGGTMLDPGLSVDVWVSLGSPTVPDVVDMTQAAAETAINDVVGLSVGSITTECSATIDDGNVISTDPAAGVETCGTTVDITVSTGGVLVPNIVGMTPANADDAIVAAGLVVGTTYTNENSSMTVGLVAEGGPVVGTCVSLASTVDIYVSAGDCMDPCHPDYDNWVVNNKPDCWCYAKQCRGDADGLAEGPFWVSLNDKDILKAYLNMNGDFLPPPLRAYTGDICADFDHTWEGPFWVSLNDKDILKAWLNIMVVPDCPATDINFWDDVGGD